MGKKYISILFSSNVFMFSKFLPIFTGDGQRFRGMRLQHLRDGFLSGFSCPFVDLFQ